MLKNPLWNHKVVKIRRRCQIQKLRPHCGKQWSLVKSCCFHATGLTLKRAENDIFAWLRDTTNGNEECVCIATLLGSIYLRTLLMFSRERKIFIRGHVFINQNSKDIAMSVVYECYALLVWILIPQHWRKQNWFTKKIQNCQYIYNKAFEDFRSYDLTNKNTRHLEQMRIWDIAILSDIPI